MRCQVIPWCAFCIARCVTAGGVAISLSGFLRGFTHPRATDAFEAALVKPLNADVFMLVVNMTETKHSVIAADSLRELYQSLEERLHVCVTRLRPVAVDRMEASGAAIFPSAPCPRVRGTRDQFVSWRLGYEQVVRHEGIRGSQYEYIVRARFDLAYGLQAPPLAELRAKFVTAPIIGCVQRLTAGSYSRNPFDGEIHDYFAIVPRPHANLFFSLVFSTIWCVGDRHYISRARTEVYCGKHRALVPECRLAGHLAESGLVSDDLISTAMICRHSTLCAHTFSGDACQMRLDAIQVPPFSPSWAHQFVIQEPGRQTGRRSAPASSSKLPRPARRRRRPGNNKNASLNQTDIGPRTQR